MTTEEDVAEAFAKEALRLDTDKQEEDVEEIPNSGQSSPLSSSDESEESGETQSHYKQQDLHQSPTSQAQQGNWMSGSSSSSGKKGDGSSAKGVLSPFQFDVLPTNPNKRKKSWQDESSPTPTELPLLKWDSPLLQSNKDHHDTTAPIASSSRPKIIKNKVYDPSYADMGLPVDPHLRLFLARREKEEENQDKESKRSENKDSEKQLGEDHTKPKG
ncbi:hypothetical protein CCACVL1_06709 [Corchorus capsularis]|uniref:Uncharacterized protein n=1 Tax=Corchorus capsularis TaxID=210143 RepID=A0A1R3JDN8_COCAP|nr:hypothetical protein CCACVL1_06709 [Corchorus capsularis]